MSAQTTTTMRGLGAFSLALLMTIGCGGTGGSDATIATTPLSGMVGGKAWSLVSAETVPFLSDGDSYSATLYAETLIACTGAGSTATGDEVLLTIPKTVGQHQLGLSLIQTFYVREGSKNYGATSGRIVVDEITTTTIRGGASFSFNAQNSVSGRFEIPICAN